jgi:beta-glucosidase
MSHNATTSSSDPAQPLIVDGEQFRDLDHDGQLAPYEDWRLPTDVRVADLVGRMTLAEKAGCMLHATAPSNHPILGHIGVGSEYNRKALHDLIERRGITAMITRLDLAPALFAQQNNALQAIAAQTRLGIPVAISSDPRHHFARTLGASSAATWFSQWPEPLGIGALGNVDVAREFGDVVRQELRAVGIHISLSPQADLATSPRWPRAEGTFGENPDLVRRLVGAVVEGIQGGRGGLQATSVAAVVKHWVGYGAARDGFDGHNYYGRYSAFPSNALDDHINAFLDALDFGVAGVMPTYNILDGVHLDGQPLEPVGAGFNRQLLDHLCQQLGFRCLILSDWAITRPLNESGRTGTPPQGPADIAMPWGVESLTPVERYAKTINAGVDQIGGDDNPSPIVHAVEAGLIDINRVNDAVTRILTQSFQLGLFEAPFVDPETAAQLVGCRRFRDAGEAAQRRALVMLTGPQTPILTTADVVYTDRFDPTTLTSRGIVVTDDLSSATVAITRIEAPYQQLHPEFFFGRMQHEGDLDFKPDDPEFIRVSTLTTALPTIVIAHLDRPAVLSEITTNALSTIAEFGASDEAIADTVTGHSTAEGRLPFRLPISMETALAQPCDRPNPEIPVLFPFGHRQSTEVPGENL